ncbi:hypothetical protein M9Y10_017549 [Tritrichomonas musculus]|uniref:Protein kinase domain-containing protein n=1 Tax=Tritrichomonas musculus TaxID=1915356 RepID=A0ABR2HTV1_9EUKA
MMKPAPNERRCNGFHQNYEQNKQNNLINDDLSSLSARDYSKKILQGNREKKDNDETENLEIANDGKEDLKVTENYIFELLQISKCHLKQEGSAIYNIIKTISQSYENYVNVFSETINKFITLLNQNDFFSQKQSLNISKDRIIEIFDEIQEKGKYFYFDQLFQITLNEILNQEFFTYTAKNAMTNEYDYDYEYDDQYKKVKNPKETINLPNLFYDKNLNFLTEIKYDINYTSQITKAQEKRKNREISIFSSNISKFIIHCVDEKKESDLVYVPFTPIRNCGSLKIDESSLKAIGFSLIDKIVIILEIAIALRDLHSHDYFHGNLANNFISINSKKDAYLGGFSYFEDLEVHQTKNCGPFYYRAPEIHVENKINIQKRNSNKNKNFDVDSNKNKNFDADSNKNKNSDVDSNKNKNFDVDSNKNKNFDVDSNKNFDENADSDEDDESFVRKHQLADIYSFGCLTHEFLTETTLESRMGNRPTATRLRILKGDMKDKSEERSDDFNGSYCDFIFSGVNNEIFSDDWKDEFGNTLRGMKEVIEKCMKEKSDERYQSFKELIESLHNLSIYQQNKEEIEFRIKNAIDSSSYQCTISDIVESYFRGKSESKIDIENFLSCCYEQFLQNENDKVDELQFNDDIIKSIFEIFVMKNNEDYSELFEDLFNYIIQKVHRSKNRRTQIIDHNDEMLLYSLKENNYNELLFPVVSLENFVKNNPNKANENSLVWLYSIAKELSLIHSNNLYYSNLSLNKIGLYYDIDTKELIPSPILSYSYYENCRKTEKTKNEKFYNLNETIQKNQRKDVKQFLKIAEKIGKIPKIVLNSLNQCDSMNIIVYHLYNYIRNNLKNQLNLIERNYSENNYSSFQVTYKTMNDLYKELKDNYYSFKDLNIDFLSIYKTLNEFLDNIQMHPNLPLKNSLSMTAIDTTNHIQDEEEINNSIEYIKSKCLCLVKNELNHSNKDQSKDSCKIETKNNYVKIICKKKNKRNKNKVKNKIVQNHFTLSFRPCQKPQRKWFNSYIKRTLDIRNLRLRSVELIVRRYIFNLNPAINYTVTIKIKNQNNENPNKDLIKEKNIKFFLRKIGIQKVESANGGLVFSIPSLIIKTENESE